MKEREKYESRVISDTCGINIEIQQLEEIL